MTSHSNFVYIYGGYGEAPPSFHSKQKFSADPDSPFQWPRGWIGNLNRLNVSENKWEYLKPNQPRAGPAGDKNGDLWIIFGGCGPHGRMNDILAFNFESLTWTTLHHGCYPDLSYYINRLESDSGIVIDELGNKLPEPRSAHSFTR